jgi:Glycosyl hydrolases family 16
MPQVLKSDPANGVTVVGGSVYYSLNSTHWQNLTGYNPQATYSYSPPRPENGNVEMATMNMAKFGTDGKFYSAKLRLGVALGFGRYEQSIKVGKGSGICTTYYLSQYDQDKIQEIDFEMSGHCDQSQKPCGTQSVLTCVWWNNVQYTIPDTKLWVGDTPPIPMPDTTSGWGTGVCRYMIDWEPDTITWSVDGTGSGNNYVLIRTQPMEKIGLYNESLCYVFISFWPYYSPRGDKFLDGQDATGDCHASGRCYQAFFFQSLKFTPSAKNNRLVTLA